MKARTNVKLNLGLRVLGRREDGFHELETLFVPWRGMGDDIEIVPLERASCRAGKVRLVANPAIDWPADKDLCVKAYRALDADWDLPPVEIRLHKQAPTGAGLGGGSADAAWTLRLLRDLFSLPLDDAALACYAAALGSDCPFFIYNRPMLGRGRGELLEPIDLDLSEYDIRVVVPEGVTVNTAQAYRDLDAAADRVGAGMSAEVRGVWGAAAPASDVGAAPLASVLTSSGAGAACEPLAEILRLPVSQWRGRLVNDFEGPVFAAWPQIAALKEQMYAQGAVYAAMSGSGSAVFGLFSK